MFQDKALDSYIFPERRRLLSDSGAALAGIEDKEVAKQH